ncbi:aspartate aminotransferase family protein [Arthrobacter sp. ISL-28]|uniref:aspartate aminotransferase family protein n=1 Tax=Arthrobacter sp. ISL-28 TaxID=2819108 RepID=UPI001BE7179E|nr:aminotransferase class III-fold pyridoxal phosphate-dependent enzyme [Arthrobacter sp. ISL-28]MBT2522552.1 aminotransferase class III-fold pyridoxal phosphate-dependent enzyme [Arthrobacter sp. ISL-28]
MTASLLQRRFATLGPYSPLFYDEPLEFVSAAGVCLTDSRGEQYLDAYNNVPQVGHCHPRIVAAIAEQAGRLNTHTRYLNNRVVDYAEQLLSTFPSRLDKVLFTNSGSEANDLAFRMVRQATGASGVLVSDFSYHGHTSYLAGLTTGLRTGERLAPEVRPIRIPDLDRTTLSESELLSQSLEEVDAAIDSLNAGGFGVAGFLFDSLFSTEGLNSLPNGYISAVIDRVHAAGGLIVADEVQSGFGRTGTHFWGHQRVGAQADFVTLGKPMANGHPVGGVVTSSHMLDQFGPVNNYFNTFAGTPVSAAAGSTVLSILQDEQLPEKAVLLGAEIKEALELLGEEYSFIGPIKGAGLFFGFEIFADDSRQTPSPERTKRIVEAMKSNKVLISRIGRDDSVLKIRPPLVFKSKHADQLLESLRLSLKEV